MNINISLSKYGDELTINVSVPTDVEYANVTIDKIAINDNSKYTVEYPISPQIEISWTSSGEFVLTDNKNYSKTFQIQTLINNGLSATGLYFIYIKLNGEPTIVVADFKQLEIRHVHNLINVYKYIIFEINKKIKDLITTIKEEANIIFTTTHKAKGMEYNQVIMTDDFITKKDILNRKKNLSFASICEELNIYYVAASRAKFSISLADLKLDYKEEKD